MSVFFPYKTIFGDVELRVTGGGLDGGEFPKNPFTPDQRLVQLYDLDKKSWRRASLDVELVAPNEEIAVLEKQGAGVTAIAVVQSPETQLRQTFSLQRVGAKSAKWHGTIDLDRLNFRGRAELTGLITGPVASREHRHLGRSEAWSIHFDEPSLLPLEGTLRVQWVDFKNPGERRFLEDHSEKPYFTDLSDTVPTVFLNSCDDFSGLRPIMEDRRRSNPWERALHDAQRVGIARSVWLAMLNTAVAAVREDEDGGPPDWPSEDWKRQVLQALLPTIYPDISSDEALNQLLSDRRSPEGVATLESRAEAAINGQVGAGKLLRRTLKELATIELPSQ